ncbi:MAG: hypothetical protein KC443_05445, partial [Anaerolineales bacterium]|nr:hypothetical protein [Anaerolineales bacterium]
MGNPNVFNNFRKNCFRFLSSTFLLITGVLLLPGCQSNSADEIVAAWAQHDGECLLLTIIPQKERSISQSIGTDSSCDFSVANILGQSRLMLVEPFPGSITLYDFDSDKGFVAQETYTLAEIEITSDPQWAADGTIYLGGIFDDKEDIYRFNPETNLLEKFIYSEADLITDPLLSPNGKYLFYWTLDDSSNRHVCIYGVQECRGNGRYYVRDLDSDTDFPISSISSFVPYHIKLCFSEKWSPSSRYLVFTLDCEVPATMVILDVENKEVVSVIEQALGTDGWLSDNELVYAGFVHLPPATLPVGRDLVYSIDTQTTRELADFPLYANSAKDQFSLSAMNWTKDAKSIVGTIPKGNRLIALVIVHNDDD